MSSIAVDADELITALEYHGYDAKYVFDRETGEVIFMPGPDITGDVMDEELVEAIEDGWGTRYFLIEPVDSSAAGM